jgi:FixJ family two-component response regulator
VVRALLVSIVDDDESVRESLPDLMMTFGFQARAFSSAEEFLDSGAIDSSDCLILDIGLPGMSGPDLQADLRRRGFNPPIVFITASFDQALRSQLLADGAVECIFKPFSDHNLQRALIKAMGVP